LLCRLIINVELMGFIENNILKRESIFQIIFILIFSAQMFSQESHDDSALIKNALELAVSNPDESIKVANHLLKKANSIEQLTRINLLLSKGYTTKGDVNKSAIYIFEANKNIDNVGDALKVEILLAKADICGTLHLYAQFKDYILEAENLINKSGSPKFKSLVSLKLTVSKAKVAIQQQKFDKALQLLNVNITGGNIYLPEISLYKSIAYQGLDEQKAAHENAEYALKIYNSSTNKDEVLHVAILNQLSSLYFQDKDYLRAVSTLKISLKLAERLQNIYLLEDIYNMMAANYLALNNKAELQTYNRKFVTVLNAVEEKDTESINSIYNYIAKEQEGKLLNEENNLMNREYIALSILILVTLFGIALYYYNKFRQKRLNELISYLEISNALQLKQDDKKEPNKKMVIPTETEQNILSKLKKFEASTRFISKDMSLATLSAQLEINSKYLSEIINKHYQDNFNTYINKLRINYIIEKLKTEPGYLNYKISYLAEESGFSSHSSFATVFKSITGIAPTTFIDLLNKEVGNKQT
jgi:YesN/AraC family two-component response regulator